MRSIDESSHFPQNVVYSESMKNRIDEIDLKIFDVQYREASLLFRDGFRVILDIVKSYIYLNAILFAAMSFLLKDGIIFNSVVIILCVIGIFASFACLIIHLRMTGYIRIWLEDAKDIEQSVKSDGVFSRTYEREMGGRRNPFQTYVVVVLLYIIVACLWGYIGYESL